MASTRLTNAMRDRIETALHGRAYADEREANLREEHALARAVYDRTYTPEQQAHMAALGKDFFPRDSALRASFHGVQYRLNCEDERSFAYANRGYSINAFGADDELTLRFQAWRKENQELAEKVYRHVQEARAVLDNCSTVRKLLDAWPEVEAILVQLAIPIDQEQTYLPAVRQDMNKVFKLPPKV